MWVMGQNIDHEPVIKRYGEEGEGYGFKGDHNTNKNIVPFDFHMLEQMCRWLRSWTDHGIQMIPMSVNQSHSSLSI